jgi:subtilisin family serine protease
MLRENQKLLFALALVAISLSVLPQSVGASVFFDNRVTLRLKSDPPLRTFLAYRPRDTERVNLLLTFSTPPSTIELAMLASLCRVETFTGHVASVNLPINLLPALASLPFVTELTKPRILKPELDVSVPEILADQVWNTAKYPGVHDSTGKTVDGTGVIIGVDDGGIDYLHRDFDFKNGTNKILFIWDQTTAGAAPEGYDYGNECTSTQIQSQTCTEFDGGDTTLIPGHGTAVAAVAASTGQASQKYYGVAPGASIIAVKLMDGSENHVLDALGYMISRARELGRPIVIDQSLGDSLGSHDGTEPLELAFTDFANQGVPIVVSAGNDRNANLHVRGILSPGEIVNVPWTVNGTQDSIDLWYPTSNVFSLSIYTPSGAVVNAPTPDLGVNTFDGNVIITPEVRMSGKGWYINITTLRPQTSQDQWSFTLNSIGGPQGKWDAWTEPGQFAASMDVPGRNYTTDPSDTIDAPGTAFGVITVGGYMTKWSWYGGCTECVKYEQENGYKGIWSAPAFAPAVGDLAYVSSIGPTRDGRIKPEIVAPAGAIATALASTAPPRHSDPDNYHQVWYGTSFAAPHVAGVIALMLQMNPYLSPNQIKTILEENGRQDNFTGTINKSTGSPLWGWGKVDALRSTLEAPNLYSVRVSVQEVGIPSTVNLAIDDATLEMIPLNQTKTITFEFRRGASHTVELTPIINLESGTRYILSDSSWTFSSGGTHTFAYQLQYYLQVNSQYGYASGKGWYDAGQNATASLTSAIVDDHVFLGWTGSVISPSLTVTLKMDSSKELVATWTPALSTPAQDNDLLIVALLILTAAFGLAAFIRHRSTRGRVHRPPFAS